MARRRWFNRGAVVAVVGLSLLMVPAMHTAAAGIYTSGNTGYDFS